MTEAVTAPTPPPETLSIDIPMSPRDQAIYMLHVGAEIEHLLMVQYLYAGYSLGGPHLTDEQNRTAAAWKTTILNIARQEMGHLATVQNLLTLVGGPISFEREDFPAPSDLYPFPFELEPLTKRSLAKYVLAEMPDEPTLAALGLTDEIKAIETFLTTGGQTVAVHRVGVLYNNLRTLFTIPDQGEDPNAVLPPFVATRDISGTSLRYQVRPVEWGLGQTDLLIETASSRGGAIRAITAISEQGEGSTVTDLPTSHFGRFLEIYRAFPADWQPAKPVARNPTIEKGDDGDLITYPGARIWAKLFDQRYRLLLTMLSHSFHIESSTERAAQSPRGLLISWAFGEMYNVRSITEILMKLPLHEKPDGKLAGPPFDMPYSVNLPVGEHNRWSTHEDLIRESDLTIKVLLKIASTETHSYLTGLLAANQRAVLQIAPLIGD